MKAAKMWFHLTVIRTTWADKQSNEDVLKELTYKENWLLISEEDNPHSMDIS